LTDFDVERKAMVESQLRTSGVLDADILSAFLRVSREKFVPTSRQAVAYTDAIQPLGVAGRAMAAPATLGRMIQLAKVQSGDSVLVIGAGLGYGAAIMAQLAENVIALEPDADLYAEARQNLADPDFGNVGVIQSEDALDQQARFDVILIEWGIAEVPKSLLERLNPGGRLVAVVMAGGVGVAHLYVNEAGGLRREAAFDAHLPPEPNRNLIQDFVF
jgi:protein-L-isoaspartate(D-aspartate) O-methyltransferase